MNDDSTRDDAIDFDDGDGDGLPMGVEERLNSLRTQRGSSYSARARQRIEYLQELKTLRARAGDDALDTF